MQHAWEEHETSAWVGGGGGQRGGGPNLDLQMTVRLTVAGSFKWIAKIECRSDKYKAVGRRASMEHAKQACEDAMLNLITMLEAS